MALSNSEKQAAWRARQAANAKRVAELEAEVARLRGKAGPKVSDKAADQLEQHLQALFEQGLKNPATMCPAEVFRVTVLLERLLIALGVVPPSKRSEDAVKYAESIKRRWARKEKMDWAQAMKDRRHLRDAAVAKEQAKLQQLKKKMHKAHPDAGGSHDEFIKARAAYEKAMNG